jgi:endonuclease/exonuclease/phosphatase family metal-dependent hydrolase
VSWENAYVPFPFDVLPQNHFGKMLSGGGVLSKHPLHSIANEFLLKPPENSRIYNHFFPQRYLQIFRVDLGGGTSLNCANLHLECFSENTRAQHLGQLMQSMSDCDLAIAGGDFNGPFALSEEAAAATQLEINFSPLPSFPSENRSLDAWLTNKERVTVKNVTTITSAGLVSDHCPVLIELEVRK